MRVADWMMAELKRSGVERVFLVPGGGAMFLNDSLAQSGIEWIEMFGEQSCGIAAEAHARVTGKLGVAMVTCGPGATNIITAITGAWIDSIPLLVIAGQVKKVDLKGFANVRQRGVQEVDSLSMVRNITKHSARVDGPLHATYALRTAIKEAMTPRCGPVWIEVPLDVQGMEAVPEPEKMVECVMKDGTRVGSLSGKADWNGVISYRELKEFRPKTTNHE